MAADATADPDDPRPGIGARDRAPEPSPRVAVLRSGGLLAVLTALLLVPLPNNYRALWFGASTDTIHVPLFALLTYFLVRFCWPSRQTTVIAVVVALTVLAEVLQPLVGRSASFRDIAYGVIGIGMATVALQRHWPVAVRTALVVALAAWPVSFVLPVAVDAIHAWQAFPVLADFDGPFSARRWFSFHGASMELQNGMAEIHFPPDTDSGSGMTLLPVVRDWSYYDRLVVDFSFEGEPLLFLISVRDGKRVPPEEPRFDLWKRYLPGRHHVEIPLADLVRGGDFSPIEVHQVQSLHLVAVDSRPRTVRVGPIRLEGRRQSPLPGVSEIKNEK